MTELGWSPKHDLDSGLRQTIDWLKSDPERLAHYTTKA